MRIYPVLALTEGSPLLPDYWHELHQGVLCKLYSTAKKAEAFEDFFAIVSSLSTQDSDTQHPAASERIDNCLAELTCTDELCLISLRNALDA